MFKLNRMDKVVLSDVEFPKRSVPLPDLSSERIFPGNVRVKALFEAECKWRLVEEFGIESFEEQPDGRLLFHTDYTDRESLLSWILTFQDKVVLLEPEGLRDELLIVLDKMKERYGREKEDGLH
ncbi:hypothetical protein ASU35_00935 [Acetivibrio ethanolgignens]|uniref:WCX domain-containing protein n=1 Tax=Acetivibrio ethanolgignens TaxID=290052 RepID=A0A0V8QGA8_9FIRM|nr:hypothetical protein ASU35_00935 [Acetivibrio ethanolgignens]